MSLEFKGIPRIDVVKLVADDSMRDGEFKMSYSVRASSIPDWTSDPKESREIFSVDGVSNVIITFLKDRAPFPPTADTEYHFVNFRGNSDSIYELGVTIEILMIPT